MLPSLILVLAAFWRSLRSLGWWSSREEHTSRPAASASSGNSAQTAKANISTQRGNRVGVVTKPLSEL
jgi:hypothetical protein